MPKGTRKCKVCGAEYEYCKTNRPTGIFRYQDVACSPEHGSIYFARILESRSATPVSEVESVEEKIDSNSEIVENEDDMLLEEEFDDDSDDELFDEEFDDDDTEELEIEM